MYDKILENEELTKLEEKMVEKLKATPKLTEEEQEVFEALQEQVLLLVNYFMTS